MHFQPADITTLSGLLPLLTSNKYLFAQQMYCSIKQVNNRATIDDSSCCKYTSALNLYLRPFSLNGIMDNVPGDDTDKLRTLRAHRRVASNPFPIIMNMDSSGESDTESYVNMGQEHESRISTNSDEISITTQSSLSNTNTSTVQSLEIADLCHSPALNCRSVSIFNFCEELFTDNIETVLSGGGIRSPEMATALLNKIHRSFNNLTSATSYESIEREDYRGMVLREILDTEQTYLTSLDTLLSVFLPDLEELVAPRDLRLLFPCQLEPMIKIHHNLLVKLEERIEGISNYHGIVGDIFGRLCSDKDKDFISVYSAYMNEFKIAMQTLVKYQNTSPLFCKTANQCIRNNNLDGLSLSSFLLTPIQRLPRYELLLKQLMKHTPEDHPDVYYIQTALESLHSDLTLLDRSIQACQFASTISRLKDDGRKKSVKKHNKSRKRHQSSRFARIKRHFSQANIDDFASSSQSSRRRPVSALEKSSGLAVSEYNILEKVDSYDSRPSSSLGASSRAISCSEVHLLDSDKTVRILSRGEEKQEEFEEDGETTPPCLSHSSSVNSHDSIIALSKRGSIYSTNSSNTSGFDSFSGMLEGDFEEKGGYDNTLRPIQTMASISSNDSGFKDGREDGSMRSTGKRMHESSLKKKSTISSALKVIRKASKEIGNSPLTKQKSTSNSNLNRLNISDPLDFRHVQHGFSGRPLSTAL